MSEFLKEPILISPSLRSSQSKSSSKMGVRKIWKMSCGCAFTHEAATAAAANALEGNEFEAPAGPVGHVAPEEAVATVLA